LNLSINKKRGFQLSLILIVTAILAIAGTSLIIALIKEGAGKTDDASAPLLCRGSVAAREKLVLDLKFKGIPFSDMKLVPLLCRTVHKKNPQSKDATKDEIMTNLMEDAASCWNTFGEGSFDDIFQEGDPLGKNECFICYTEKINLWKGWDEAIGPITTKELIEKFHETPKEVKDLSENCKNNQGICISGSDPTSCKTVLNELSKKNLAGTYTRLTVEENNIVCKAKYKDNKNQKNNCCYSTSFCEGQGGICSEKNLDLEKEGYRAYDSWSCPSNKQCYVKNEQYVSYLDYIQRGGGANGNLVILDDISPSNIYAIAFGSPTTQSGIYGTIAQIVGGSAGATAGVYTGSLLLSIPGVGWVTGGTVIVSSLVIGAAIGVTGGKMAADQLTELIVGRPTSTIYIANLDQIKDHCGYIEESL